MHVLYTFLQYFPHATINWIQICEFGPNSGVSLYNDAIVARTRWAFQVLQGSVETLFRWGGKRLYRFIANLFRKPCIKFHENHPSFVWDITKNILVSFFSGHTVHVVVLQDYTIKVHFATKRLPDYITSKSKPVSIVFSLLCDTQVSRSSLFHDLEPTVILLPVLWTADHFFHDLLPVM